jgi:hypothetical protein
MDMAKKQVQVTRRDRWADWAVVGLLAVALLLGWGVMALAQGQQQTYADSASGLTLGYPQGWLLGTDETLLFQALDPDSGTYRTRYQVRAVPIEASGLLTPTLGAALNDASLRRAQEGTAYRLFDVEGGAAVNGLPTMEASYVFVSEGTDFFTQRMPVVVKGLDIAVPHGDKAYIFSLLADANHYDAAERQFRRFVAGAEWQ